MATGTHLFVKRINTLGVPLSKYEVLNGLYNGESLRGLHKYVEQDKDAKSVEAKLTDKNKEIKDIIVAIVNNISVDTKRLFSSDDKQTLLHKQTCYEEKYHCASCNKLFFKEELTVDHIEPKRKGGRTVLSNAQLLCNICNNKKGNTIV